MCHSAVPHGAKRSRLILYENEPEPYNYDTSVQYVYQEKVWDEFLGWQCLGSYTLKPEMSQIIGFKKASGPLNYPEDGPSGLGSSYCFTTSQCNYFHSNQGGYDP